MSTTAYHPPPPQELSILYVSQHLIILDKPSGLLTVPGRGIDTSDCLLSRVQARYPDSMIVHRLDMATSGIVVMGRGAKSQRELSILFQERQVRKAYQALLDGQWTANAEGEINLPMMADWPNRPRQRIDPIHGRPCLTRYRVIHSDASEDMTRIELFPVTGRSHQLRLHMESAGHPILGDALYGTEKSRAKADRLMLHASFVEFTDPMTGTLIRVTSPLPF